MNQGDMGSPASPLPRLGVGVVSGQPLRQPSWAQLGSVDAVSHGNMPASNSGQMSRTFSPHFGTGNLRSASHLSVRSWNGEVGSGNKSVGQLLEGVPAAHVMAPMLLDPPPGPYRDPSEISSPSKSLSSPEIGDGNFSDMFVTPRLTRSTLRTPSLSQMTDSPLNDLAQVADLLSSGGSFPGGSMIGKTMIPSNLQPHLSPSSMLSPHPSDSIGKYFSSSSANRSRRLKNAAENSGEKKKGPRGTSSREPSSDICIAGSDEDIRENSSFEGGRSVPCSCTHEKQAVCKRYRQNGLKDKATMEDEIKAIRLEIEGKRDDFKELVLKEEEKLRLAASQPTAASTDPSLSLPSRHDALSSSGSTQSSAAVNRSGSLDALKAEIKRCEEFLGSWKQQRQKILKAPSKKVQRKMMSDIAKRFKPCRPKYMQKCIETSGNMSHSLDMRRAVGKSKDIAKRHYIQLATDNNPLKYLLGPDRYCCTRYKALIRLIFYVQKQLGFKGSKPSNMPLAHARSLILAYRAPSEWLDRERQQATKNGAKANLGLDDTLVARWFAESLSKQFPPAMKYIALGKPVPADHGAGKIDSSGRVGKIQNKCNFSGRDKDKDQAEKIISSHIMDFFNGIPEKQDLTNPSSKVKKKKKKKTAKKKIPKKRKRKTAASAKVPAAPSGNSEGDQEGKVDEQAGGMLTDAGPRKKKPAL